MNARCQAVLRFNATCNANGGFRFVKKGCTLHNLLGHACAAAHFCIGIVFCRVVGLMLILEFWIDELDHRVDDRLNPVTAPLKLK